MQLKDVFSRKNVLDFSSVLLQYPLMAIGLWYHFTAPRIDAHEASIQQKEVLRRGKLTSIVLCIVLTIAFGYIPVILSMGNIILVIIYMAVISFIASAAPLNRRGKTTVAGLIVIVSIELTLVTVLLIYPGGLNVSALPLLSFLIIPTLLAVSMLPSWSVFFAAFFNLCVIYASVLFLPKTPDLQALLASSPQTIFGMPTMLQCMISAISFLWVRGALQGIKEADRADELDRLYQELARVAELDAITGLPNHRAIMKHMLETIAKCEQTQQPCTIMFIDLDHFKQVNDTWGHLVGDAILQEVGQRLSQAVSSYGIVGRYGGEEFVVVLQEVDLHLAYQIAEQARTAIASTECCCRAEGREIVLNATASIGIATYGLHGTSLTVLLEMADQAMYRAKQHGRNYVCIADIPYGNGSENIVTPHQESPAEVAAVQALTAAAQAHDMATEAHASRLIPFASSTASQLGCSPEEQHLICVAALLHDIGKIGVPEAILRKPGALTAEEWEVIHTHPTIGAHILTQVEGVLDRLSPIVKAHHERWDGRGYPAGLTGDAIPLGARIISVVDSYDAMTSTRPYRQALSHEHARTELLRCAGTQYDPRVVMAFLESLELREPSLSQSATPASAILQGSVGDTISNNHLVSG